MAYSRWQIANSRWSRFSRGFTLIELLISISIIAILISIAVVQYSSVNQRSRDGKRKADLERIRAALEMYRADNRRYPDETDLGACSDPMGNYCWYIGSSINWIPVLVPNYMQTVPIDPKNSGSILYGGQTYAYVTGPGLTGPIGQTYALVARLENKNDPDACGNKVYKWPRDSDVCGAVWEISSDNRAFLLFNP